MPKQFGGIEMKTNSRQSYTTPSFWLAFSIAVLAGQASAGDVVASNKRDAVPQAFQETSARLRPISPPGTDPRGTSKRTDSVWRVHKDSYKKAGQYGDCIFKSGKKFYCSPSMLREVIASEDQSNVIVHGGSNQSANHFIAVLNKGGSELRRFEYPKTAKFIAKSAPKGRQLVFMYETESAASSTEGTVNIEAVSPSGEAIWSKTFSDSLMGENLDSLVTTTDGKYVVASFKPWTVVMDAKGRVVKRYQKEFARLSLDPTEKWVLLWGGDWGIVHRFGSNKPIFEGTFEHSYEIACGVGGISSDGDRILIWKLRRDTSSGDINQIIERLYVIDLGSRRMLSSAVALPIGTSHPVSGFGSDDQVYIGHDDDVHWYKLER